MSVQDLAQLKKLAEEAIDRDDKDFPPLRDAANPSTILALLSELEQAERERDDRQQKFEKLQYELSQEKVMTVAYQARSLEYFRQAESSEAALRTLRQASAQAHHWLLLVTLDFPKGSLCHSKSEAVAANLAAALAAEGGK